MRDTRQCRIALACVPLLFGVTLLAADSAAAILREGRSWRAQRQLERALESFQRGIAQFPGVHELQLEAGRTAQELGQPQSAIEHLEAALKLKADLPQAHTALGILRSERGELEEAALHLRSALALDESSVAALHALGVVLERQGDFPGALQQYSRARELDPREPRVRLGLGGALERLGRLEDAHGELVEAVKLNGKHSGARYKLAMVCLRLERREEGEKHLAEFRSLKAQEHCDRGEAEIRAKNLSTAIREFGRALDVKPDHVPAHARLGALLLNQGDVARALEHARRAADLEPTAVRFANLAWSLHVAGKKEQALEWIDKAITSEPTRAEFRSQRQAMVEAKPEAPK